MRIRATTKVSNATAPMRSLCAVVVPDRFLVAWIRDFPLRGFGVTSPMPPLFDQVSTLSQFPDSTALWVNDILVWIGFGTLVGLLAQAIMPGRDPGGAVTTLLMGIGGVIIGCGAWSLFSNGPRVTPVSPLGMVVATAGAFTLLFFYRLLGGRWFLEGEGQVARRTPVRRRRRSSARRREYIYED